MKKSNFNVSPFERSKIAINARFTKKLLITLILSSICLVFAARILPPGIGDSPLPGVRLPLLTAKSMPKTPVQSSTYRDRVELFTILPSQPQAVVFLGDSLTANCEWAELLQNPAVINRGISGDTTYGVHKRLEPILAAQPAQIFLMIGINDLRQKRTIAEITTDYRAILHDIRQASPQTEILIQSVLPVNTVKRGNSVKNSDIIVLNQNLKALAADYGAQYIDLYRPFVTPDGQLNPKYSYDGLHLNGAGYLHWRQQVKDYVTAAKR